MPYWRVSDSADSHPKLTALSDGAHRLWFAGQCHVQRHLTDGFISDAAARHLRGFTIKRARELTQIRDGYAVGLWVRVEGGFQVHDHLDHNDSREQVKARRKAISERVARYRHRTEAHAGNAVTNGVSNASCNPAPHLTSPQIGTNEEGTRAREAHATTEEPPTKKPPKGHHHHCYCGERFCVSAKQHAWLNQKLGRLASEVNLLDYYGQWDQAAATSGDPVFSPLTYLTQCIERELRTRHPAAVVPFDAAVRAADEEAENQRILARLASRRKATV